MSNIDLPKLKTIYPGSYSFKRVKSFVIEDLPLLEVMKIGSYSFFDSTSYQKSGSEFKIENCPSLVTITAYSEAFRDFQKLTLTNLTSLQSITTNQYSFYLLSSFEFSGKNCMKQFIIVRPAFVTNFEFRPV